MSRARRRRLLARREQLLMRSATLRYRFGYQARHLQAPFAVVDAVGDGLRWLREHPAWPAGVAGLLVVTRPRRLLRWAVRGFGAWRLWQRIRPYAAPLLRGLARR